MIENGQEQNGGRPSRWRATVARVRRWVKHAAPFSAGVLAALGALLLYSALFPPERPLSKGELRQVIDQTMASATPPPAFSATVYQTVRPSLVLIETHSAQ